MLHEEDYYTMYIVRLSDSTPLCPKGGSRAPGYTGGSLGVKTNQPTNQPTNLTPQQFPLFLDNFLSDRFYRAYLIQRGGLGLVKILWNFKTNTVYCTMIPIQRSMAWWRLMALKH